MQSQIGHITWRDGILPSAARCPACDSGAPKSIVLKTAALTPEEPLIQLLLCAECGARYWDDLTTYEYESIGEHAWSTIFYIEQGAGIDALIEPIARLSRLEIKRCLEIGCGFGFSLDAGQKMFGWTGVGADPSPLARAGREALGIDIRHIYADTDTDLGGAFDLVYGSEVIEHVADPHEFLRICRAHLRPGGLLVLTTPDAASIRPDVSSAALMPILSPGHHLVLYGAEALERVVRKAGFAWVQMMEREHGLVLYAADAPLEIEGDTQMERAAYRSYLTSALAQPGRPASLYTGLRYRLFKDLVNQGQYQAALAVFGDIVADCRTRFGLEPGPENADEFGRIIRAGGDQAELGAPFCLPGILFFRGMIALNDPAAVREATAWFDAATSTAAAFRSLYQRFGIDDGETGMIEKRARELALLASCHGDPELAVTRLRAFAGRDDSLIESAVLRLMDLGHMEKAREGAGLSSDKTLAALVQGWMHILAGEDAQAHEIIAVASSGAGAIADRARAMDMIALASVDPQAAVSLALELKSKGPISLKPLFQRLVDHGNLAQAAMIESSVEWGEDWELTSRRATLALLHDHHAGTAAELFAKAFDQAAGHASDVELWRLKYHELLGRITAADSFVAARVAREIRAAGDTVPAEIRDLVDALLQQHPSVRPSGL
jgi:2-polyprenyl-3-methyl-5-hydroxy-6-metoxy-1,4-benzoquinol methylase